jgi:tRNA threonylcarbamoyladenosine modification (KEOPS) complex  Pcc1 subunit
MKKMTISIHLETAKKAEVIAGSLIPELRKNIPHTQIDLEIERDNIILTIKAHQTNTLRAACNSYIRWIQTALSVHDVV